MTVPEVLSDLLGETILHERDRMQTVGVVRALWNNHGAGTVGNPCSLYALLELVDPYRTGWTERAEGDLVTVALTDGIVRVVRRCERCGQWRPARCVDTLGLLPPRFECKKGYERGCQS